MRTALINPPAPFLTNQKVFPNLGLISIATQMRAKGFETDVINLTGDDIESIDEYDIYGIGSTSPQFKYAYQIAKKLKDKNKRVVLGGPHASAMASLRRKGIEDINFEALELFDAVIEGEGENAFGNISQKGWRNAGIVDCLDNLLAADRTLVDIDSYDASYMMDEKTANIMTQRGCPHQCTFCCGRDIEMYNKTRNRSPENIVAEMDFLHEEFGFNAFMWYDDEVNLKHNRLMDLCDRLSERNYKHRGFIRADQIVKHPEQVEAMKKAGFVKLCAGVESGSDRILDIINKKTTYAINLEAARRIKEAGIHYEAFVLLGHPSETLEDISYTEDWILETEPDDFDLNIVTPYPGSRTYDDAVLTDKGWNFNGLYFDKPNYSQDDTFYKGKDMQSASNVRTDKISNADYINIRNTLEEECQIKR